MAITRVEVLQPTYSVEVNNLAIPTGPGATIKTTGIRVVGDELVTNGKFDTDSSWAKTEFTILNGQAIATAGTASYIDQPIQFVSGKSYEITLDIISITGGSASIQARGITTVASTITSVDSGTTYRFIYTDTSDNTTLRVYAGVDTNLIVDNISVKEIALIANLDDGVIVNDLDVKLGDAHIVYSTGYFKDKAYSDSQKLHTDIWYVRTGLIESYGLSKND